MSPISPAGIRVTLSIFKHSDKLFLLFLGLILLVPTHAVAERGYLIIDAVLVPAEERQPKWLALRKGFSLTHVRVGASIVDLKPGSYDLVHIDFHKNWRSGEGTITFYNPSEFRVEIVANAISYLGLLQIEKHSRRKYHAKLIHSWLPLEWACHARPDLFKQFPVREQNTDGLISEFKVRCEN